MGFFVQMTAKAIPTSPDSRRSTPFRQALNISAAALCALALGGTQPAGSVTFDLFLVATPTVSSNSETAPMTVNLSSVYQLGFNSGGITASSYTQLDNADLASLGLATFDVDQSLSYANHQIDGAGQEPHDAGEPGQGTADRYNAQVSTWDDVGIANVNEEDDPEYNIDFGRNASVIFDAVAGGYTDLIIAEDGGLNPFDMYLCSDADCSISEQIFNGFNRLLREALAPLADFTLADSTDASEVDQALVFRFYDPVTQFLKITEDDNRTYYTGQRLEVDFVGVGGTMAPVPGPAGLPLVLTGFGALIWIRRRKTT